MARKSSTLLSARDAACVRAEDADLEREDDERLDAERDFVVLRLFAVDDLAGDDFERELDDFEVAFDRDVVDFF